MLAVAMMDVVLATLDGSVVNVAAPALGNYYYVSLSGTERVLKVEHFCEVAA